MTLERWADNGWLGGKAVGRYPLPVPHVPFPFSPFPFSTPLFQLPASRFPLTAPRHTQASHPVVTGSFSTDPRRQVVREPTAS